MRLLDLYCGPGGAAVGYHRAGFDVVGVDIEPQPDYPFEFHQADALSFLEEHGHEYDAVHASPPCTEHTTLTASRTDQGTAHYLADTLAALVEARPAGAWVVENVMGAEMPTDLILCGTMFGLRTYRHRRFTIGLAVPWIIAPSHPRHRAFAARKQHRAAWARGEYLTVIGNRAHTGRDARRLFGQALGIDWVDPERDGINLAIPPDYTHFIGCQLMDALRAGSAQ